MESFEPKANRLHPSQWPEQQRETAKKIMAGHMNFGDEAPGLWAAGVRWWLAQRIAEIERKQTNFGLIHQPEQAAQYNMNRGRLEILRELAETPYFGFEKAFEVYAQK